MAVLGAERALFALRESSHTRRLWLRWSAIAVAGGAAAFFAINELQAAQKSETCFIAGSSQTCTSKLEQSSDATWAGRLATASLFALGATVAVSSFVPDTVERLADVWESDPGRVRGREPTRPTLGFAPVTGGGRLQVEWSF
jgi:hypothetical protein